MEQPAAGTRSQLSYPPPVSAESTLAPWQRGKQEHSEKRGLIRFQTLAAWFLSV